MTFHTSLHCVYIIWQLTTSTVIQMYAMIKCGLTKATFEYEVLWEI